MFGWGKNDRIRSWIITAGWFGVREKYCSDGIPSYGIVVALLYVPS